jgi:hypothetical protein
VGTVGAGAQQRRPTQVTFSTPPVDNHHLGITLWKTR